jgi:hypothetical protein
MADKKNEITDEPKPICGIVMPISATDNCTAEHWGDVMNILREVIRAAGFEPNLVSDADDIGIIQKRIVQNIYSNDIIICDVSAKNPNVMFELGMRLAFDKATIIIKDDFTDYSFDTGVIEHLGYPRDLRFNLINDFREKLKNKLIATHKKSKEDPNYSTFLKSFGEFKIAQLQTKEVSSEDFILESLGELKYEVRRLRQQNPTISRTINSRKYLEDKDDYVWSLGRGEERCISESILNYAESAQIFTPNGLVKDIEKLIDFVQNDGHIVDAHSDIEINPDIVKRIISNNSFKNKLMLRKRSNIEERPIEAIKISNGDKSKK